MALDPVVGPFHIIRRPKCVVLDELHPSEEFGLRAVDTLLTTSIHKLAVPAELSERMVLDPAVVGWFPTIRRPSFVALKGSSPKED